MKVVAIIQARMGSTRLPGKVLLEVLPGRTMLDVTIERIRACKRISEVVIAVPDSRDNDPVACEAARCGAKVFRGSEEDVLGRYVGAAVAFEADLVVRVTSDCPLSDPAVIDLHVERMQQRWHEVDFVTNMMHQTFPLGISFEAMPLDTLARMDRLSTTAYLREHVTTIAYERPEWFIVDHILDDADRSEMRWTVDYPEDLEFVRAVFRGLYIPERIFSKADILEFLAQNPDVVKINAHVGK